MNIPLFILTGAYVLHIVEEYRIMKKALVSSCGDDTGGEKRNAKAPE
jgi:hypothetical protein